jgi:hypothetical protein
MQLFHSFAYMCECTILIFFSPLVISYIYIYRRLYDHTQMSVKSLESSNDF